MWSDVPRSETTNHGRLSLEITTADDGLTAQLQKIDFSGGFGGSLWSLEVPGWPSTADRSIQDVFNAVKRGGKDEEPLFEELKPYKDHVVLFGNVILTSDNFSNGVVHVNAPGVGASYAAFIPESSPSDGDLVFDIQIDRAQLDIQADFNFWTDGWESGRNPNDIRNKLDNVDNDATDHNGIFNFLDLELVMFARTAEDGDIQHYNDPPLLPGWQEKNGNSVLLNGRPINGNLVTAGGVGPVGFIGDKVITEGTRIRVTGPLILDCGHFAFGDTEGDPCHEDDSGDHNQEIHPVYAIDIIDTTPSDDLSGTWADDLGRTYYVRQLDDNTLWWLGMSPFRDHTFARVFQGTINRQDQTITGQWADVPLGQGQSNGSLTLQIDPGMLTLLPFEEGFQEPLWTKLYHAFPPPPPPPPPGVFINGETEIKVDLIDVKADPPTVTYTYTIAPVSLQDPLTVDWSSKSRYVQFADHTAQSTDITFDLTGLTRVGRRRTVQVDVSVTDALGTQVKDSVSVTITVTPTT